MGRLGFIQRRRSRGGREESWEEEESGNVREAERGSKGG